MWKFSTSCKVIRDKFAQVPHLSFNPISTKMPRTSFQSWKLKVLQSFIFLTVFQARTNNLLVHALHCHVPVGTSVEPTLQDRELVFAGRLERMETDFVILQDPLTLHIIYNFNSKFAICNHAVVKLGKHLCLVMSSLWCCSLIQRWCKLGSLILLLSQHANLSHRHWGSFTVVPLLSAFNALQWIPFSNCECRMLASLADHQMLADWKQCLAITITQLIAVQSNLIVRYWSIDSDVQLKFIVRV